MSSYTWYAKPSGGYSFDSVQAKNNMALIYQTLKKQGYTIQAVAGLLGNVYAESAFNPWRYEDDKFTLANGYGLFQYTRADEYLNDTTCPDHYPNRSVTTVTSGALAKDALGQLYAFYTDRYTKWVDNIWRDTWDTTKYATQWQKMLECRSKYGRYISQETFKNVTDVSDATFLFLGGFEGPRNPSTYSARLNDAYNAYDFLWKVADRLPIWMYFQFNKKRR